MVVPSVPILITRTDLCSTWAVMGGVMSRRSVLRRSCSNMVTGECEGFYRECCGTDTLVCARTGVSVPHMERSVRATHGQECPCHNPRSGFRGISRAGLQALLD